MKWSDIVEIEKTTIVVPDSELSCTADWFIAECQKRMAVAPR